MTVKMLARELYALIKEVEDLEKKFNDAPPQKKDKIADELRVVKAERAQMQRLLDGRKDEAGKKERRF